MMNNKRWNKKGFILETSMVIVILFVLALAIFLGLKISNEFNEGLPPSTSDTAKNIALDGVESFGVFNSAFALLFVGMLVLVAVSFFFIPSHPIFFVFSLIGLAIIVLMGVIFSNAFEMGVEQSEIYNETLDLPIKTFQNLPMIMLIFSAIVIIVLFAKHRSDSAV